MIVLADAKALERIAAEEITALTETATGVTFYTAALSPEQVAANRRIVAIAADACFSAAASDRQHFAAAFVEGAFAGYVIATHHGEEDRELDWLMVHPRFHGTPVSAALMEAGIAWLGADRALWLNVIRHNERAIRFYRRFGFEIDPDARTDHVVLHAIMRRPAAA
jgi:ribosomal protein S18 acetylase RimI-like enzyme